MSKTFAALGLISGTSLDGIDVALIETDGEGLVRRGPSATYAYDAGQQALLRRALADAVVIKARSDRPGCLAEAEEQLTAWHAQTVQRFLRDNPAKVDVVGFHGQTVLHKPAQRLTVQLGDGPALARATGLSVAYDLRAADVAAGGQGAPLVPIYHAALAPARPCAFVNIGGVANVTYIGNDGGLLAFDTGPGNALINDWMMQHKGVAFDEGGQAALAGRADLGRVQAALQQAYFSQRPPKSLDRNSFRLGLGDLSVADGAATLAAFTVQSIAAAAQWFPEMPRQWIICGGGRHNGAIMSGLRARLDDVASADDLGFNGDSMEAEAWAYLAVRSLRGLPISFPGTTGAPRPMSGGVLVKPA